MAKIVIGAGAFKQGCLALIEQVAATKREIVITKRGVAVARLIPMEDANEHEARVLASWRHHARQLVEDEQLMAPSSSLVPWRALDARDE